MQNGGELEGPIEAYPKFWNMNPLAADKEEVLRIPAWKGSFDMVKKEYEMILEREILPTTVPEFPMVRRMTLGMNSPLVVPFLHIRATVEKQQKEFTDPRDPLFFWKLSRTVFPHVRHQDKLMDDTGKKRLEAQCPRKFEVRDILRTLEQAELENKLPIWDDGRMIVEEGHNALKDEMSATRKYRAPYGLEQLEMKQQEKELDAAGPLYVAPTE